MGQSLPFQFEHTPLTQEYLTGRLTETRQKHHLPAVAVAAMSSKTIWFQEIQGVRVFDRPEHATLDDYFQIGSCSKSVLAVIAALLVEQKLITWQTKFFDVFPELADAADSAYHGITLEDLFLCQAGIKAYTNAEEDPFPDIDFSARNRRMEFIRHLIAQPPAAERRNGGFRHLYSNASYTMASAMLERTDGRSYEELATKTLTDALGLSVHIGWPNSMYPDQPWGHLITKKKTEAFGPDHEYRIPDLITPAGDLSMTPRDYARYTQLHLQGLTGKSNYITGDSYRHIHFSHKGFSLGVSNGVLGGTRYSGFDGSAGTFFCRSILVPESDFALTIMTNAGSGTGSLKAVDWLTQQIVKEHFNWWWKFWLWW